MSKFGVFKYLQIIFILFLLVSPAVLSNNLFDSYTNKNNSNKSINSSLNNIQIKGLNGNNYKIITNSPNSKNAQNPLSPNFRLDSITRGTPVLQTETQTPSSGFTFLYNKTESDYTHNLVKPNNYNLTVTPIDPTGYNYYNNLNMNINAYTNVSQTIVEPVESDFSLLGNYSIYYAQGALISKVNTSNIYSEINAFTINAFIASAKTATMVGEIWNATKRTSDNAIVPNKMLASTTYTTVSTGTLVTEKLKFSFGNNVEITNTNTFSNASGSYVFFIIHLQSGNTGWNLYDNPTASNNPTYVNSTGLPSTASEWGNARNINLAIHYNSSFAFNERGIETKVASPITTTGTLVQTNGNYVDTTTQIAATDYRVYYNSSLTNGLIPLLNITYSKSILIYSLASTTITTKPNVNSVNWTITYDNSLYTQVNSNVTKSIYIPSYFIVSSVYLDTTPLTQGSSTGYYIQTVGNNNTVNFNVSTGVYKINATSTNALYTALLSTYNYTGSAWATSTKGNMGTLYPIVSQGDLVNATVTNIGTLSLSGGTYNASLRTETGAIIGNDSITGVYVDQFLNTKVGSFSGNLTFATRLDPNIPTGIWTFQFRWENGTNAGAVAIEFDVVPVTTMSLVSPIQFNIPEGDLVNISISTLDESHNSTWVNPGNVTWQFDNFQMTPNGKSTFDQHYYNFTAQLNTSILAHPTIQLTSYLVNVTFIDNIYYQSVTFTLTIIDPSSPQFTSEPGSPTIAEDSTGNYITWNLKEDYPANYTLYVDTKVNQTGSWNSTEKITFNLDKLAKTLGTYNYTLYVNDTSGNYAVSKNNDITVADLTFPVFVTNPTDFSYEQFTTGHSLTWNTTDKWPGIYTLYKDKNVNATGSWTNAADITQGIDGLGYGIHNFTIVVSDAHGNSIKNSVFVTVTDSVAPVFSVTPTNQTYSEGGTNILSWASTDANPATYTVYENKTIYGGTPLSWSSATTVNFPIDTAVGGLSKGIYNFTIVITDLAGNELKKTVWITVVDSTAPAFSIIPNNSTLIKQGTTGNSITWTPTDRHPNNYSIYMNGVSILNNTWTSGGSITQNIDGLSNGVYNFTIIVFDTSGHNNTNTAWVIVDGINPNFTQIQNDLSYYHNNTAPYILSWTANDTNPGTYIIYKDGVQNTTGSWTAGVPITFNLGNLPIGVYNFKISVIDQVGWVTNSSVVVTVLDPGITYTLQPSFSLHTTVQEGDVETVNSTWFTVNSNGIVSANITVVLVFANVTNPTSADFIKRFTIFTDSSGKYQLAFNYTGLLAASYKWIIYYQKLDYQSQIITTASILLIPHTIIAEISALPTLTKNQPYTITVRLTYENNTSTFYLDQTGNQFTTRTGAVKGVNVVFIITVQYNGAEPTVLQLPATTNNEGVAAVTLQKEDTARMTALKGVTVNIASSQFNLVSQSFNQKSISIKEPTLSLFQQIVQFFENNQQYLFILIGTIAALLAFAILYLYLRKRKRIALKKLSIEASNAVEEIDALVNIRAIILRNLAGIPFYQRVFSSEQVNVELITGITTAISSFMDEVTNTNSYQFETMQRSGFSLTSFKGFVSNITIISDKPIPEIIKPQLEQSVLAIETQYGSEIDDSRMVNMIKEEDILKELEVAGFKIMLKYPLKVNAGNIKRMMNVSSIKRNVRSEMQSLIKMQDQYKKDDKEINLESMIQFLQDKELSKEIIAQIIMLAHLNNGLSIETLE